MKPTTQWLKPTQHVIREELNNGAMVGDEVTSLCGETYRMRVKDDPNMLTCGMCSLLLVREYRDLLRDYNLNLQLIQALDDAIARAQDEAHEEDEEEEETEEEDSEEEDENLIVQWGTAEEGGSPDEPVSPEQRRPGEEGTT